jgi:hypothetical protein
LQALAILVRIRLHLLMIREEAPNSKGLPVVLAIENIARSSTTLFYGWRDQNTSLPFKICKRLQHLYQFAHSGLFVTVMLHYAEGQCVAPATPLMGNAGVSVVHSAACATINLPAKAVYDGVLKRAHEV